MIEFRLVEGVAPNFLKASSRIRDGVNESGPLGFLDIPELVAVLAEHPGFAVLTAADLDGPFDAAAWPGIDRADIDYWKPETLGEALFNYWD
ncbi:hypothetical protein ACWEPH_00655 [Nocardia beijingensis]